MAPRFARSRWLLAFVAVLLSLCVLTPVADAATCVVEIDPSHVTAIVTAGEAHQDDPGVVHGACSHGHCHHGVKAPGDAADADAVVHAGCGRVRAPVNALVSVTPEGLKRPPRA